MNSIYLYNNYLEKTEQQLLKLLDDHENKVIQEEIEESIENIDDMQEFENKVNKLKSKK